MSNFVTAHQYIIDNYSKLWKRRKSVSNFRQRITSCHKLRSFQTTYTRNAI